jgi:hypothetical protein
MTTAAIKPIDYVELQKPGVVWVHMGQDRYPVSIPASYTFDELLGRTQAAIREFLRNGTPVLDEHGWTDCPLASGLKLLNAHDLEFVFKDCATLHTVLEVQPEIELQAAL